MSAAPPAPDDPALPGTELVLVGGGHAHVQVLKALAMERPPGVRVTLVSDDSSAFYSGMMPGCVAELYTPEETRIELRPLARHAGARFVRATVTGLEPEARRVLFDDRPPLAYDLLSLNVGSTVRGLDVPGVREHAVPTRPIGKLIERLEAAERTFHGREGPLPVAVVGGGSAGVELAFCVEARLRGRGLAPVVTLLDAQGETLPEHGPRVAAAVEHEARRRGVRIERGFRAAEVRADAVIAEDGREVAAALTLWATGGAPHPFLRQTGLPLDDRGFLEVDATLQVPGHPEVFAAGDTVAFRPRPLAKAGVFAVREGPVLTRNLRAAVARRSLEAYRPQSGFLALLALGDGRAVLSWKGLAARGRWAWALKDWIDRRFMERFAPETLRAHPMAMDAGGGWEDDPPAMPPMRCAGCGSKVGGSVLARALEDLEVPGHEDVVAGLESPDDAALVRVPPGKLQAQTLDYFPAPLDDPYVMGRVATVHAASDLFAMGAEPVTALALATLPYAQPRVLEGDLRLLMAGIADALREMGAALVGGHTTEGPDLGVGVSMTGLVDEGAALRKAGLAPGDALVLTKPLGTGVLLAADMQLRALGPWIDAALESMLRSNQVPARLLREHGCTALTDVTGFGLAGHLAEMLAASGVGARIEGDAVPLLPGVVECLEAGVASTLDPENRRLLEEGVALEGSLTLRDAALFDPQTSGGLLAGVPEARVPALFEALEAAGHPGATRIGTLTARARILEVSRGGSRP